MYKSFVLLVALLSTVASAQNDTSACAAENRANCFKCLSTGGACFFCSTLGCRDNTAQDHTTCTQSEGSATDLISHCPDPCYNPDSNGCSDCLSATCGYCLSSGSCMTGTSTGPSYKTCGTWRFRNRNSTLTTVQLCSAYQTCSSLNDCSSCATTAQDANTPCTWCDVSDPTGGNSTCVADQMCSNGTATTTCPGNPSQNGTTPNSAPTMNNPPIGKQSAGSRFAIGFVAILAGFVSISLAINLTSI